MFDNEKQKLLETTKEYIDVVKQSVEKLETHPFKEVILLLLLLNININRLVLKELQQEIVNFLVSLSLFVFMMSYSTINLISDFYYAAYFDNNFYFILRITLIILLMYFLLDNIKRINYYVFFKYTYIIANSNLNKEIAIATYHNLLLDCYLKRLSLGKLAERRRLLAIILLCAYGLLTFLFDSFDPLLVSFFILGVFSFLSHSNYMSLLDDWTSVVINTSNSDYIATTYIKHYSLNLHLNMKEKFKNAFDASKQELNESFAKKSPFTPDGLKLFNVVVEDYITTLYRNSSDTLNKSEKISDYHVKKAKEKLENTRPKSKDIKFKLAYNMLGVLTGIAASYLFFQNDFISAVIVLIIYIIVYFYFNYIEAKSETVRFLLKKKS